MSEWLVIAAIVLAAASGLPALFCATGSSAGERIALVMMALAAGSGMAGAIHALVRPSEAELAAAWSVPGGRLAVHVDALSALFVLQIVLLALLGAVYGLEYFPQRAQPRNGRKLRVFYGLVTAGLLLVVAARNAVLFLGGWELMALGAFILVSAEDEKPVARASGYLYLVSTRLSTLCLFAMFALLAAVSGSLDFADWPRAFGSPLAGAIFVLALIGFGLKAGAMPLHIWLPGAHANTPSHVSALMSGVLIKMGIYGLVRVTSVCAIPQLWWGYTVLAAGVVSSVLGVAFAIGQHDLKRLLAYHSVENIGIILLGIGVALLGRALGHPEWVTLGMAGALLHTFNHGLFKALLFLSAGSVLHATGTRELDRLGGLWRRMPATATAFMVGAVAICGLPPLNGLVSELLVYLGLFRIAIAGGPGWLAGAFVAPALALVGALALACFVKVVGTVFLGEPRSGDVAGAHESGRAMLGPMAVLGVGCLFIGLGAPWLAPVLDRAVAAWSPAAPPLTQLAPLVPIAWTGLGLIAALALLGGWLHARVLPTATRVETWGCGYAAPTPRMQYTSSSFADAIVRLFGWALWPERHPPRLASPFPTEATFHSHVPDTVLDRGVRPVVEALLRVAAWVRPLHRGSVHLYLLYILGALLALLLWS